MPIAEDDYERYTIMGRGYWLPPQHDELAASDGFFLDGKAVYTDEPNADWEKFLESLCRKLTFQDNTFKKLCNWKVCGTLNNTEVQAKCPFCGDYKYRMYLCHREDSPTFWCHNCGTGGNAVTLYAQFNPHGIPMTTGEAYVALLDEPSVRRTPIPIKSTGYTDELRPLHERSQIYLDFLSVLDLEEKHLSNLRSRGLSDEMINGNMYRSIPTDTAKRRRVMDYLSSKYDLTGMPGFYTANNRWQIANCKYSGILIPILCPFVFTVIISLEPSRSSSHPTIIISLIACTDSGYPPIRRATTVLFLSNTTKSA